MEPVRIYSAPRRALIMLAALALFISPCASTQVLQGEKQSQTLVADGTIIHLVLMDDLQGQKLKAGQTVHFKVREDLVVDSRLIVRTGTGAIGHIESISKSGLLGKSGRLVLAFDYAEAVSGERIPLRGNAGVSGGKGGALTWESALWYGPNASLPVGTVINAYVNHDQRMTIR